MAAYFQDGKLLFVDGKVAMHADCCCDEVCCSGGKPTDLEVGLSGIGSAICSMSVCDHFNGTFTLAARAFGQIDGEDINCALAVSCCWGYFLPSSWCSMQGVFAYIKGTIITIGVTGVSPGVFRIKWSVDMGDTNCNNMSSVNVPYVGDDGWCDGAASTCTVTAL